MEIFGTGDVSGNTRADFVVTGAPGGATLTLDFKYQIGTWCGQTFEVRTNSGVQVNIGTLGTLPGTWYSPSVIIDIPASGTVTLLIWPITPPGTYSRTFIDDISLHD